MCKNFFILFAAILSITYCPKASSATGFVKGQVEFVRTHDGGQFSSWTPPTFWFTLKGVATAGSCRVFTSGTVLFVSRDKQAYAMLMAAQLGGQEISIYFDDTVIVNTHCLAGYITMGNPSPLY